MRNPGMGMSDAVIAPDKIALGLDQILWPHFRDGTWPLSVRAFLTMPLEDNHGW